MSYTKPCNNATPIPKMQLDINTHMVLVLFNPCPFVMHETNVSRKSSDVRLWVTELEALRFVPCDVPRRLETSLDDISSVNYSWRCWILHRPNSKPVGSNQKNRETPIRSVMRRVGPDNREEQRETSYKASRVSLGDCSVPYPK